MIKVYKLIFSKYLYMSFQLLQQCGVFVKSHEGLTETGGQGKDSGSLAFHELIKFLAIKKQNKQRTTHTHKKKQISMLFYTIFPIVPWEQTAAS